MRNFHFAGLLGALALSFGATPSHAYEWLVSTTSDGIGVTGCSIREAVKAAATNAASQDGCTRTGSSGNNVVRVPVGTYPLTDVIQIKSSLSLIGTISSNSLGTHITRNLSGSTARGLRVSVGLSGPSYVTFKDLVIRDFLHTDQPAILVDSSQSAGLDRVILRNNEASSGLGGGIRAEASAYVYISGSWIDDNTAARAGGIRGMSGATVEIINTTLSRNQATQEAGAVWADFLSCDQCTFAQNTSTNRFGGAIYVPGNGVATIYRSTLTENTALLGGPNIYVAGGAGTFVTMAHSVMKNGTSWPDCGGHADSTISSGGYNVISFADTVCQISSMPTDQINVNPTLNTYYSITGPGPVWAAAVLPKPPTGCGNLLDKATTWGTTDQLGNPRVRDYPGCSNAGSNMQDIGAIENPF